MRVVGWASRTVLLLALIALSLAPLIAGAQAAFAITITDPPEGAQITGPFTVQGTSTVPPEKQLTLKVFATSTNEQLITLPLPVSGEVGQLGSFRIVLSYIVVGDTPALIQVVYTAADGSVVAKAEVHVVLRKYEVTPGPNTDGPDALSAVQLALTDYEARVQVVTPIPLSVADNTFNDGCLGLARPGETCTQGQVDGKIVKLSFGGVTYTYHVGNNQARLDESQSGPINVQGGGKIPKPLADASAATGVKLFVPTRPSGPFEGLFFKRVDWENGVVTIVWGADNNPVDIQIIERGGNAVPTVTKPTGENIKIGSVDVQVQVDNGRRYVEWLIQTTVVHLSVPQNISNSDLAALANGFTLLGAGQPGQTNPLNWTQFGNLTLNLAEPIRSAEMARQALMGLLKPVRRGGIISIQARRFADGCLELGRNGENCTAIATPGYVIGIADTELYRYHVAGSVVRLNRANSELRDKNGADYASLDAARSAAPFILAAPTDTNLALLGIQVSQDNNAFVALLLYRDNQTGGVLALRETASGALPGGTGQDPQVTIRGAQVPVRSEGGGRSVSFIFQQVDRAVLVTLWSSPEIKVEDLTRIANSLAA